MASSFLLALLGISVVLVLSCEGQQLHVKHAPSYVVFQEQTPDNVITASNLHNVISQPLGLTTDKKNIFQSKSVLKRPKANVLITVATHKDQSELPVKSLAKFPVEWDTPFVDVEQLMNNVQAKFLEKEPFMLDLVSNNQFFDVKTSSDLFQSLPASFAAAKERLLDPDSFLKHPSFTAVSLNASLSSDGGLLAEIQMVQDVVDKLKENTGKLSTGIPDLLSFTLTGLKSIGDEYGVNSEQAKDAQDVVTKHIDQITDDLKKLYRDNVMIEVLTVPVIERPNIRKTRSLMAAPPKNGTDFSKLNLALDWDQDFPVTFQICFWLTLILVLTVMFIAYGIWNMNPNLESILYRVPQDEMKKMN